MVKSSLSVRVALRYVSWGCLWVAAANLGVDVLLKGHGHHDYSDVLVDLLQMFPIALVMFFLLSRELSARQQAESARLVSEQQLANILKTAPSAIIGADETGQILLFNPGAERIFKYRARKVLGKSISELVPDLFDGVCHPDQERGTAAAAASAFAQRQVTGRRADDTHFAAEVSVSELIQDEGSLLTIVLNDISRRRAAEDEIIRSRELLEIRVSERTEALHRDRWRGFRRR